jgi:hypothetical protein
MVWLMNYWGSERRQRCLNRGNNLSICLEGIRNTAQNLSQNIPCPSREQRQSVYTIQVQSFISRPPRLATSDLAPPISLNSVNRWRIYLALRRFLQYVLQNLLQRVTTETNLTHRRTHWESSWTGALGTLPLRESIVHTVYKISSEATKTVSQQFLDYISQIQRNTKL